MRRSSQEYNLSLDRMDVQYICTKCKRNIGVAEKRIKPMWVQVRLSQDMETDIGNKDKEKD